MRKITIAAALGAVGLMIAAVPASALSSYQVQTDGGANFDGSPSNTTTNSGFSMTTRTSKEDPITGLPIAPGTANFGATSSSQPDLSRDMNWQGTGYYLRPNN